MLLGFAFISIFIFWSPSILILISSFTSSFIDIFTIYGKSLDNIPLKLPEVEITSPKNGESLYPSSELTIKGTSSDNGNINCTILTSLNNIQPFQNASGTGSQGKHDLSNWNSTFFNATNLLRLGNNMITSFIVCLDTNSNTHTSSSHLINLTGLPNDDNQSILSSVSRIAHDGLENKIAQQQPESSDQSTTNLQNNLHAKPIHHNNDQGQSQSQSTVSPNSGQSTTGHP
jgi:hypothetical protein